MAVCAVLMAVSPLPFTVYYYNLGHFKDAVQSEYLCFLHKVLHAPSPRTRRSPWNPFPSSSTLSSRDTLSFSALRGLPSHPQVLRFIAVHYPLDAFSWCSRKRLRRTSRLIVAVSLLLTAWHFLADTRVIYNFCIPVDESTSFWVARCFIGHGWLARLVGVDIFGWAFDAARVLLLVGPSTALFVLTALLIRAIRLSRTRLS